MLRDLEALPLDIDFNPINWDYEVNEFAPEKLEQTIYKPMEIFSYEIDEETLQEVGEAIEEIESYDFYHY